MFCAHLFPFVSGEESNKSPLQAPDSMYPFLYLIFNNMSYLARSITSSFNNNKMHFLQGLWQYSNKSGKVLLGVLPKNEPKMNSLEHIANQKFVNRYLKSKFPVPFYLTRNCPFNWTLIPAFFCNLIFNILFLQIEKGNLNLFCKHCDCTTNQKSHGPKIHYWVS